MATRSCSSRLEKSTRIYSCTKKSAREIQVERPPKVPAASHQIHSDVETFVRLGSIPRGSTAFLKIFASPTNTSVDFKERDRWTDSISATADFCKTSMLPCDNLKLYNIPAVLDTWTPDGFDVM
ncbi:hypothetical protein BDN67DRAFT_1013001 [Paxillus ammoniavirescens]|nr:hypothetical protein BDN67DRAFT_1013001 [Paxillus ammoniavirescens]